MKKWGRKVFHRSKTSTYFLNMQADGNLLMDERVEEVKAQV